MNMCSALRLLAGIMVLVSTLLVWLHSPYWLLLNAFVGLNLVQSAFTQSCPAISIFKKFGINGRT